MKSSDRDSPPRILLVDDEPQITRVLRTALSTQGYSLRVAANGVEGLSIANDWSPHLVITDLAMPQMDGVELCRELRAVSQVPIIILSVRNQDRQKIEALDAGDFYIDVPQHRVLVRGNEIHLTPKQFDLLICFAEHPDRVLTHRALLQAVWGTTADQPEYLRVNIGQLRKKIETTDEPRYILTEPWIGYRFRPTGDDGF